MKIIFFLTVPLLFKSQSIKVVDSLNNKSIPFAKIISKDHLYLTDSSGVYIFEKIPTENVTISAPGYENKATEIKSNLLLTLTPKIIPIEEVKISSKKLDIDNIIGYKNGKQITFISENIEYAIELKNDSELECKIDNIEIPFKKSKNKKGYLLLDMYENKNGRIGNILNNQNYIIPISSLDKNNLLKVKDNIYFHKNESIYIAVTWIENIAKNSDKFTNIISFFSLPKGSNGKMYSRRTTYQSWDTTPLIENQDTKSSFIPAFRIHTKCRK